mgnify:CR=1 FL=1
MDKKVQALVEQYANSLLEVAIEHGQLAEVKEDVLTLKDIFESNDLNKVMTNFALSHEDKGEIVRLLQESSSSYVKNFLEVILQNEREDLLYIILKEFLQGEAKATNTHDIRVTTAVELSEAQKNRILAIAKEKLAIANGQLVEVVDKSIVGGFIINANNKVVDASIRHQLRQFKQNLK